MFAKLFDSTEITSYRIYIYYEYRLLYFGSEKI
jgi:hypothetical protein